MTTFEGVDRRVFEFFYRDGGTLYVTSVLARSATKETDPSVMPFFDSFRLEDPSPPLPVGWERYRGDGFTAAAPSGVSAHVETVKDIDPPFTEMKVWTWHNAESASGDGSLYRIARRKMTPALLEKFKTDAAAAWKEVGDTALDGLQLAVADTTVGSLPGKEYTGLNRRGQRVTLRLAVKGEFVFTQYVHLKTDAAGDPNATTFFGHFRID